MECSPRTLPADGHVHSEWSWDAPGGSMEGACARAVELGLPAVAFTEHVDYVRWVITDEARSALRLMAPMIGEDGRLDPPPLDIEGYLACVERCRERYPSLRILTGIELGEPHWFAEQAAGTVTGGRFERVLGSLHTVLLDGRHWLVTDLFEDWAPGSGSRSPGDVLRAYLEEALRMVSSAGDFAVLAHLDYPLRAWPADAPPCQVTGFEEEFRAVLAALARSGRALEVNTRLPMPVEIVRWWFEAGGEAVSFGSDAHRPEALANGFAEAAALVESCGFSPGRHPHDFWHRHR